MHCTIYKVIQKVSLHRQRQVHCTRYTVIHYTFIKHAIVTSPRTPPLPPLTGRVDAEPPPPLLGAKHLHEAPIGDVRYPAHQRHVADRVAHDAAFEPVAVAAQQVAG